MRAKATPNGGPSVEEAKALAREYYKKLEAKEAAKRQASIQSPASIPPQLQREKSPRKATRASSKKVVIADANRRAKQYYETHRIKLQTKKDQSSTPFPPKVSTATKVPRSSTAQASGISATSWFTTQKSQRQIGTTPSLESRKSSRMIDTLYDDMLKLEQMEEQESCTDFGTSWSQPNTHSFSTTGNIFGMPNANTLKPDTPFRHTTQPMETSQRPYLRSVSTSKTSSLQPPLSPLVAVHTHPVYSAEYNVNPCTNNRWLGRLFTTLDIVIFAVLYMLEMKFHILLSIGLFFIRFMIHLAWKMIVNVYQQGIDTVNFPTTLMIGIGCCIVVQYSVRPSTLLLQSCHSNRKGKLSTEEIQSDVGVILNMVYNELMKQDNVNVPIRSLQDSILTQVFMDESMDSTGGTNHQHLLTLTKDRNYWNDTIWPRVIGQLLYRDPFVVVERKLFQNDNEMFVRWKSSHNHTVARTDSGAIFKKRKAV